MTFKLTCTWDSVVVEVRDLASTLTSPLVSTVCTVDTPAGEVSWSKVKVVASNWELSIRLPAPPGVCCVAR